eukprot:TRINITY_DN10014_c0_g1_i1.p1 TRINITY_DN10014_c0_g1~~TRINITY_DN10014_c0_g1_i1.p1  ORF type:complete len:712 (-),score=126.81 TRINITY_DN10014_c0_g1_i1:119-2254(-)
MASLPPSAANVPFPSGFRAAFQVTSFPSAECKQPAGTPKQADAWTSRPSPTPSMSFSNLPKLEQKCGSKGFTATTLNSLHLTHENLSSVDAGEDYCDADEWSDAGSDSSRGSQLGVLAEMSGEDDASPDTRTGGEAAQVVFHDRFRVVPSGESAAEPPLPFKASVNDALPQAGPSQQQHQQQHQQPSWQQPEPAAKPLPEAASAVPERRVNKAHPPPVPVGLLADDWHRSVEEEREAAEKFDGLLLGDDVTTVMLKNLSERYTRTSLMLEINAAGFEMKYDFIYMPISNATERNPGYAFINFIDAASAQRFYKAFHKQQMEILNAGKPAEVVAAVVQGYEANFKIFSSSRVKRSANVEARPLFLRDKKTGKQIKANLPAPDSAAALPLEPPHGLRGFTEANVRYERGAASGYQASGAASSGNARTTTPQHWDQLAQKMQRTQMHEHWYPRRPEYPAQRHHYSASHLEEGVRSRTGENIQMRRDPYAYQYSPGHRVEAHMSSPEQEAYIRSDPRPYQSSPGHPSMAAAVGPEEDSYIQTERRAQLLQAHLDRLKYEAMGGGDYDITYSRAMAPRPAAPQARDFYHSADYDDLDDRRFQRSQALRETEFHDLPKYSSFDARPSSRSQPHFFEQSSATRHRLAHYEDASLYEFPSSGYGRPAYGGSAQYHDRMQAMLSSSRACAEEVDFFPDYDRWEARYSAPRQHAAARGYYD